MSLSKTIEELEKEMKEMNESYSKNKTLPTKRRSLKQACLNLLNVNYSEVLIILKRIDSNLKRIKYLKRRLNNLSNGRITNPKTLRLLNEDFNIIDDIKVNIKSLYIWVYNIKTIFSKCQINIDDRELRRISYLRSKFITHIVEIPLFNKGRNTQTGMRMDANCEKPEFLFHDIFRRHKITGFGRFVKQAEIIIPELKNETNIYERIYIIYRNLNKLQETELKSKAEGFIERIGIATEPPQKIADELLKSLKDYRQLKRI